MQSSLFFDCFFLPQYFSTRALQSSLAFSLAARLWSIASSSADFCPFLRISSRFFARLLPLCQARRVCRRGIAKQWLFLLLGIDFRLLHDLFRLVLRLAYDFVRLRFGFSYLFQNVVNHNSPSVFDVGNHIQTSLMSAALVGCGVPCFDNVLRLVGRDDSSAQSDDICVVVAFCHLCHKRVRAHCRADALDFVCGYGNAYTRAAHNDAEVAPFCATAFATLSPYSG